MNFISSIALLSLLVGAASGFQVLPTKRNSQTRLFSAVEQTSEALPGDQDYITSGAKERLLDVAYGLKDDFGVFIVDSKGQKDLRKAVDDLEAVSNPPSFDDESKKMFLGNWTLVCTTSSNSALPGQLANGIDTSKLPFFNQGPLKEIRNSLNKCLVVQQVIMARDSDEPDRIDHVLEYKPPKNLQEIIDNLPSLNINPLDVTQGKVVLVHDADVVSTGPGFSTKLNLDSIVVNVAGRSQFLEPGGKDVVGINMPLKEFQAGTFETTFLSKDLRISRGKVGSIDQLRVYVKEPEETLGTDPYVGDGPSSGSEGTDFEVEILDDEFEEDDDFGNPDPDPGIEF